MKLKHLTVTQKIAAGYLLLLFFSLVAVIFALTSLHGQTRRSERLLNVDTHALVLSRELRTSILALERLEKQFLVLGKPELLDLLKIRQEEFHRLWMAFSALPVEIPRETLAPLVWALQKKSAEFRQLMESGRPAEAEQLSGEALSSLRLRLIQHLDSFHEWGNQIIDRELQTLSTESGRAYRITVVLVVLGALFGTLAALSVIFNIRRSIHRLSKATQDIGSGNFDLRPDQFGEDEFGRLAGRFCEMGNRLKELEQLHLDANPLTRLPGNLAIERELQKRIAAGLPFAHALVDLDHFKAYNDRYGYQNGSKIIAMVGEIIRQAVSRLGDESDMVGHIGGDDYVILTTPERIEPIAEVIIEAFDREVPGLYSEEDREAGFFMARDRFEVERRFPLMSISIAIVCSENFLRPSPLVIGAECAKMKDHLKNLAGSNFLIDRRRRE